MDNVIIFCAKYLIFLIPLLLIWVLYKKNDSKKLEIGMALLATGLTALILVKLSGSLYNNPRPFVADGSTALISHGNDNGFPSEHTVLAISLASLIYFYHRRLAAIAIIAALLVGWGRVAAHVHHAVDILGGVIVGVVAAAAGYWLAKKLTPKKSPSEKAAKPN